MDACTYPAGTWEIFLLPSATGGAAKAKARAERRTYGKEKSDATIRSCEADEQSGGALVAESVERSVAPKGKCATSGTEVMFFT